MAGHMLLSQQYTCKYFLRFDRRDVENWLDFEILDDVRDGIVEDAMDLDEEEMDTCSKDEAWSIEENDDDGNTVYCAPLPTRRKISKMFYELEAMCFNCNFPYASSFLRRAKRKVEAERAAREETGKQRQMLLIELWKGRK